MASAATGPVWIANDTGSLVTRADPAEAFRTLESELNRLVSGYRPVVLCLYDLNDQHTAAPPRQRS